MPRSQLLNHAFKTLPTVVLQKVIENKIFFVHPSLFNKGGSDGPATPAMAGPLLNLTRLSTFSPTTTFTDYTILLY